MIESPGFLADKNKHLINILASHFRAVSKGHTPFSLEWKKIEVQDIVGKDQDAIRYMTRVGAEVKRRAGKLPLASIIVTLVLIGIVDILKEKLDSNYARGNQDSLNMKFSSRLMLDVELRAL